MSTQEFTGLATPPILPPVLKLSANENLVSQAQIYEHLSSLWQLGLGVSMKQALYSTIVAIGLSDCASTVLTRNTLDLASTTDSLLTRQIGHNLANFIDSRLAFPSQLVITSGTATTADSISPTFSYPFAQQVTNTLQTVSTVGTNPSTQTTHAIAGQRAGNGLSVTGTDTQTQNWSYSAITNSRQARRLAELYRFVVDGDTTEANLIANYPRIQKSIVISRSVCLQDRDNGGAVVYSTASIPNPDTGLPTRFTSCVTNYNITSAGVTLGAGSKSFSILVDDDYYLRQPHCVVCLVGRNRFVANPRLKGNWLHWRSLPGAARSDNYVTGDLPLGVYGNYELFVDQHQPDKFTEFSLFVLAAGTDADAAISSGGSGGGAGSGSGGGTSATSGGKASPAIILVAPNALQ